MGKLVGGTFRRVCWGGGRRVSVQGGQRILTNLDGQGKRMRRGGRKWRRNVCGRGGAEGGGGGRVWGPARGSRRARDCRQRRGDGPDWRGRGRSPLAGSPPRLQSGRPPQEARGARLLG